MAKRKRQLRETQQQSAVPAVEVVVFQDPAKKRAKEKSSSKSADDLGSGVSFDWHKARHEVFRFGITGMAEKDKMDAKVSQAVRLGARVSCLIRCAI